MSITSKSMAATAALLLSSAALAALAPNFQNIEDLEVMLRLGGQHTHVAATVTSLRVRRNVIHCGKACEAVFERAPRDASKPPMPGPQAPLVFTVSNCSLTGP
ncbi:MAG: hypothetical protein KIT17_09640 [Rubrivivax sp.]|nr:hypothetical protein [Rubrivivax sp.]